MIKTEPTTANQQNAACSAGSGAMSCPSGTCASSEVNVGNSERLISGLIGGCLMLSAPARSVEGWVMAIAGGGLLYRAITGHCYLYQGLEMSTAD